MSINPWVSQSDANRLKKSYINGFVDISTNFISRNGNLYFFGANPSINTNGNFIWFDNSNNYTNFNQNIATYGNLKLFNGSLILNNLILSNNNLQRLQYLSNVSFDVSGSLVKLQNNINNINTSSLLSTANTWAQSQTFNNDIYLASYRAIRTPVQNIYFDDTYLYVNISNNAHIYGTLQLDYGTTYDVGFELNNTRYILTNVYYDSVASSTNLGSNNLSLNGSLILPTATISNTTLSKIPYLANVSSDIDTSLTNLNTKTTNISYDITSNTTSIGGNLTIAGYIPDSGNSTIGGIKTFSSPPVMSGASITSGTIPTSAIATGFCDLASTQSLSGAKTFNNTITLNGGIQVVSPATTLSSNNLSYLGGSTSNLQTQINNRVQLAGAQNITGTKTYTVVQNFSNNIRLDGSLLLNAGALTITNAVLQCIQYISGLTSDLATTLSNITSKITNISYTSATNLTTIGGNLTISNPPVMSGASITASSIPDSALVLGGAYVSLGATDQNILGNKSFANTVVASSGVSIASGQSYTGTTDTRLTSASGSTTYINNDKTSGDLRINTGSASSNTYIDNGNVQINQANSATAKFSSGTLTGGGGTDYCETLSLTSGIYGCQIQGGLKQTVGDRFNICFNNNGAPVSVLSATNTGTPSTNVIDATGIFRINGTNVLDNSVLIGSINMFPFTLGSAQYKLCNGQQISRTTYSVLFSLIGTTFGGGDGLTTFNVPDYRACFLRGNGSQILGGTTYTSNAIGTYQEDSLLDHNHGGQSGAYLGTATGSTTTNGYAAIAVQKPNSYSFANTSGVTASYRSNVTENRPINFSVNFYIKVL